jgi:hypothetical protein
MKPYRIANAITPPALCTGSQQKRMTPAAAVAAMSMLNGPKMSAAAARQHRARARAGARGAPRKLGRMRPAAEAAFVIAIV